MAITMDIANFSLHKVFVDNGSSAAIIFWEVIRRIGLEDASLKLVRTPPVGFGGSEITSLGTIDLPVSIGEEPKRRIIIVKFLVVDTPFAYKVILGRPRLNLFQAMVSTYHMKMKFPTQSGIGEVLCDQKKARRCYNSFKNSTKEEKGKRKERDEEDIVDTKDTKKAKSERIEPVEQHKLIELMLGDLEKVTRIYRAWMRSWKP
ncbi:UNVERIFIED_CONTAM: hypothetical protein Sangu_2227800 [Sesamum angustifolium]|uniref:Uncharacterized protein n=1 Tax=Sesamum angustifolium TaxID=2727405 RepID=A0AAW2L4K3_9LAMI